MQGSIGELHSGSETAFSTLVTVTMGVSKDQHESTEGRWVFPVTDQVDC